MLLDWETLWNVIDRKYFELSDFKHLSFTELKEAICDVTGAFIDLLEYIYFHCFSEDDAYTQNRYVTSVWSADWYNFSDLQLWLSYLRYGRESVMALLLISISSWGGPITKASVPGPFQFSHLPGILSTNHWQKQASGQRHHQPRWASESEHRSASRGYPVNLGDEPNVNL